MLFQGKGFILRINFLKRYSFHSLKVRSTNRLLEPSYQKAIQQMTDHVCNQFWPKIPREEVLTGLTFPRLEHRHRRKPETSEAPSDPKGSHFTHSHSGPTSNWFPQLSISGFPDETLPISLLSRFFRYAAPAHFLFPIQTGWILWPTATTGTRTELLFQDDKKDGSIVHAGS